MASEFVCDICGKTGISHGKPAKRHRDCQAEYRRRYYNTVYAAKIAAKRSEKDPPLLEPGELEATQKVKAEIVLHRFGLNVNSVRSHCRDIRIALGTNNTTPRIYIKKVSGI